MKSSILLKYISDMFFKNIMDKQVHKPLKYKMEHRNLWDSVIIAKKHKKKIVRKNHYINTNQFGQLIVFFVLENQMKF